MGVAEKERKWARRVSELENLWGEKGRGGVCGGGWCMCVCQLNIILKNNLFSISYVFSTCLNFLAAVTLTKRGGD